MGRTSLLNVTGDDSSTAARMETASAAVPMSRPASVRRFQNIFNLPENGTALFAYLTSSLQQAAGRFSKASERRRSVFPLEASAEFAAGTGVQTSTCTRTARAMARLGRREESR